MYIKIYIVCLLISTMNQNIESKETLNSSTNCLFSNLNSLIFQHDDNNFFKRLKIDKNRFSAEELKINLNDNTFESFVSFANKQKMKDTNSNLNKNFYKILKSKDERLKVIANLNNDDRFTYAKILAPKLTQQHKKIILNIHQIGAIQRGKNKQQLAGVGNYTFSQIRKKYETLAPLIKQGVLTKQEARNLFESATLGKYKKSQILGGLMLMGTGFPGSGFAVVVDALMDSPKVALRPPRKKIKKTSSPSSINKKSSSPSTKKKKSSHGRAKKTNIHPSRYSQALIKNHNGEKRAYVPRKQAVRNDTISLFSEKTELLYIKENLFKQKSPTKLAITTDPKSYEVAPNTFLRLDLKEDRKLLPKNISHANYRKETKGFIVYQEFDNPYIKIATNKQSNILPDNIKFENIIKLTDKNVAYSKLVKDDLTNTMTDYLVVANKNGTEYISSDHRIRPGDVLSITEDIVIYKKAVYVNGKKEYQLAAISNKKQSLLPKGIPADALVKNSNTFLIYKALNNKGIETLMLVSERGNEVQDLGFKKKLLLEVSDNVITYIKQNDYDVLLGAYNPHSKKELIGDSVVPGNLKEISNNIIVYTKPIDKSVYKELQAVTSDGKQILPENVHDSSFLGLSDHLLLTSDTVFDKYGYHRDSENIIKAYNLMGKQILQQDYTQKSFIRLDKDHLYINQGHNPAYYDQLHIIDQHGVNILQETSAAKLPKAGMSEIKNINKFNEINKYIKTYLVDPEQIKEIIPFVVAKINRYEHYLQFLDNPRFNNPEMFIAVMKEIEQNSSQFRLSNDDIAKIADNFLKPKYYEDKLVPLYRAKMGLKLLAYRFKTLPEIRKQLELYPAGSSLYKTLANAALKKMSKLITSDNTIFDQAKKFDIDIFDHFVLDNLKSLIQTATKNRTLEELHATVSQKNKNNILIKYLEINPINESNLNKVLNLYPENAAHLLFVLSKKINKKIPYQMQKHLIKDIASVEAHILKDLATKSEIGEYTQALSDYQFIFENSDFNYSKISEHKDHLKFLELLRGQLSFPNRPKNIIKILEQYSMLTYKLPYEIAKNLLKTYYSKIGDYDDLIKVNQLVFRDKSTVPYKSIVVMKKKLFLEHQDKFFSDFHQLAPHLDETVELLIENNTREPYNFLFLKSVESATSLKGFEYYMQPKYLDLFPHVLDQAHNKIISLDLSIEEILSLRPHLKYRTNRVAFIKKALPLVQTQQQFDQLKIGLLWKILGDSEYKALIKATKKRLNEIQP